MIALIMMMMSLWTKLIKSISVRLRKKWNMLFKSILTFCHLNWALVSKDFIIWNGEVGWQVVQMKLGVANGKADNLQWQRIAYYFAICVSLKSEEFIFIIV